MQDLQEVLGRYEPRRGKTTTKKEQKSRTHLFISLAIVSNHIKSPLIIHVSSIIVRVDQTTIHVPGNDSHGTIVGKTPNASYITRPICGNQTIMRWALCLRPRWSAEN